VHKIGIPRDDKSGKNLPDWMMGLLVEDFYDKSKIAILPIGFCYPRKGKQETYHHDLNALQKGMI